MDYTSLLNAPEWPTPEGIANRLPVCPSCEYGEHGVSLLERPGVQLVKCGCLCHSGAAR